MDFDHVIYSDLDGTLLELETYDSSIASRKVQLLQETGIPLIFCSSKTLDEQLYYQEELGIHTPMIVENGAGVAIPVGFHPYFENLDHQRIGDHLVFAFSEGYDYVVKHIHRLRNELDIELLGYHDLETQDISKITGLAEDELERTTNRLFSETLLVGEFHSPNFQKLRPALFLVDLQCTPGSKFYTVSGISSNKGKAIKWLNNHLLNITEKHFTTLGIGDSYNDIFMFNEVDEAYLVQKPNKDWVKIDVENLRKINKPGPYGFNEFVETRLGFS